MVIFWCLKGVLILFFDTEMSNLRLYLICLHLHLQWQRVHFVCMNISIHIYSKVYPLEKHKQIIFWGTSFLTLSRITM